MNHESKKHPPGSHRKTPEGTTEFEREQLRFFLAGQNVAAVLVDINPSLAWLPILTEMRIVTNETQLAPWIERNFSQFEAVREVVANIRFFGHETADILQTRLEKAVDLPPLLKKCWGLIIRHMGAAKRGALRNSWFTIAPRLKRGEQSQEVLECIAQSLRPSIEVSKRLSWRTQDEIVEPTEASDLMFIQYKIDEDVTAEDVLAAWPQNAAAEVDVKLLELLTNALTSALEDAIDAGVEGRRGYGISDSDVPSVAAHGQNAYHAGFLPIVRVSADLWSRLAAKDVKLALQAVSKWRESRLRLIRRLALFAAADGVVPARLAASMLITLPPDELFLAGSSVEVHRLLRTRAREFSADDQEKIQLLGVQGPPGDSFREGAEKDRAIASCRFEFLGALKRSGLTLGPLAERTLADIRRTWPEWELRPEEQAGFHVWSQGVRSVAGDSSKLDDVPDDKLVATAKKATDESGFRAEDDWGALCKSDPSRVLRALEAQANSNDWDVWGWRAFLWAGQSAQNADIVKTAAHLLLRWPRERILEISYESSWWLNEKAQTLEEDLLWELWDRIEEAAPRDQNKADDQDPLTRALNATSGRLAEVLLKAVSKVGKGEELPEAMRRRFDKLIGATGSFGTLARARLAVEVSFLFERIPTWTKNNVVPLFSWSSPDAAAMWAARKYSNYIGSPELFDLTKVPFLELFARPDIPGGELGSFAEWLTAIVLANQSENGGYPLKATEARSALRVAGPRGLSRVAHRLAVEMGNVPPAMKLLKWREVIGPAFQSLWPLDADLQTSSLTFKLVQILRTSGEAFPEAAECIIPFIRPEDQSRHTTVFSISEADDVIYSSSPQKMLDLLSAVVGDGPAGGTYGLRKALDRLKARAPELAQTRKFQKLLTSSSNV